MKYRNMQDFMEDINLGGLAFGGLESSNRGISYTMRLLSISLGIFPVTPPLSTILYIDA